MEIGIFIVGIIIGAVIGYLVGIRRKKPTEREIKMQEEIINMLTFDGSVKR
ncbi:MAG: hypothetical protein GX675_04950 [Erysipelotrichaceae bacterium]|nr:hypothetical protein [Erysipelotrichaceae bacterium]